MLSLKQYMLITMGHLLPIEFVFYLIEHSGINNLEYINYMYMVIVAMHGIFWFSRKLKPYIDTLDVLVKHKPEIEHAMLLLSKPKSGVTNESDEDFMNRVGART